MTTRGFPRTSTASASAGAKAVKPGQENARAKKVATNTRLDALHDLLGEQFDVQSTGETAVHNKLADEDTNENKIDVKDTSRWKYERAYCCLPSLLSFKLEWLPSPLNSYMETRANFD